MSSNVREFNLSVEKFAKQDVPEQLGKVHRALMHSALASVVQMSPVDTGRFRANWNVTTGQPATGTTEDTDKGGGATIAKGAAVVAGIKPYSVSWLTNNLPYAESLENGSSQQAPRGMVDITVARLASRRQK